VRASAGLTRVWASYPSATGPVYSWIFYEPTPASPLPRDLFNALNQGRSALGLQPVSYPTGITAPTITGAIRWQHLDAIRAGVK